MIRSEPVACLCWVLSPKVLWFIVTENILYPSVTLFLVEVGSVSVFLSGRFMSVVVSSAVMERNRLSGISQSTVWSDVFLMCLWCFHPCFLIRICFICQALGHLQDIWFYGLLVLTNEHTYSLNKENKETEESCNIENNNNWMRVWSDHMTHNKTSSEYSHWLWLQFIVAFI